MDKGKHTYRLEAVSHSPFIAQMNLYLCIASFDDPQQKATAVRYRDAKPALVDQTVAVETELPALFITVGVYVVPQEYPRSDVVADSPDFPLEYRVLRDGEVIGAETLQVNRWGGVQVINIRYE